MEVRCCALVNGEDDNTTQMVNIKEMNTFDVDVETDGKLGNLPVNWLK